MKRSNDLRSAPTTRRSGENEGILDNPKTLTASIIPIIYYHLCCVPNQFLIRRASLLLSSLSLSWLIEIIHWTFYSVVFRMFPSTHHAPSTEALSPPFLFNESCDCCHFFTCWQRFFFLLAIVKLLIQVSRWFISRRRSKLIDIRSMKIVNVGSCLIEVEVDN